MARKLERARYLYYVSPVDLGEEVVFYPRVPIHRHDAEDDRIKRVCVAPTVLDCFLAACCFEYAICDMEYNPFFVYRTEKPEQAYKPTRQELPDGPVTNERWILHKTKLVKARTFKMLDVPEPDWDICDEDNSETTMWKAAMSRPRQILRAKLRKKSTKSGKSLVKWV